MATQALSVEEIGQRGKALYESDIRPLVEEGNKGRYVTIDVETGAWEMGDDLLGPSERLRAQRPDALLFTVRVGYPSASRIGHATAP